MYRIKIWIGLNEILLEKKKMYYFGINGIFNFLIFLFGKKNILYTTYEYIVNKIQCRLILYKFLFISCIFFLYFIVCYGVHFI